MRTAPIDLQLGGAKLRVVCGDPEGSVRLRAALARYLIDEPAPLGYVVEAASPDNRLTVVMDRSGVILGRTTDTDAALGILHGILASVVAAERTERPLLTARVIVTPSGGAHLLLPPLGLARPLIERRLERSGYSILDSALTGVDATGHLAAVEPLTSDLPVRTARGHTAPWAGTRWVERISALQSEAADWSEARRVATLASALTGPAARERLLTMAERLADVPLSEAASAEEPFTST